MSSARPTSEQLAKQIVDNSAALIAADLNLKATSQRHDKLMQQAQKVAAANPHDGRIFWLMMGAASLLLAYASYLVYTF